MTKPILFPALSHADVIDRIGGPTALGKALGQDPNTTKPWRRNDSIPSSYWWAIAHAGLASLEELAFAKAIKAHKEKKSSDAEN